MGVGAAGLAGLLVSKESELVQDSVTTLSLLKGESNVWAQTLNQAIVNKSNSHHSPPDAGL